MTHFPLQKNVNTPREQMVHLLSGAVGHILYSDPIPKHKVLNHIQHVLSILRKETSFEEWADRSSELHHGRHYFLHVTGPDGPAVFVAQYVNVCGHDHFSTFQESYLPYDKETGTLHKWKVLRIETLRTPNHITTQERSP